MPFCLEMSQNINSTTRHFKIGYISIFRNLRTDNETKSVKTLCNRSIKKVKKVEE